MGAKEERYFKDFCQYPNNEGLDIMKEYYMLTKQACPYSNKAECANKRFTSCNYIPKYSLSSIDWKSLSWNEVCSKSKNKCKTDAEKLKTCTNSLLSTHEYYDVYPSVEHNVELILIVFGLDNIFQL